MAFQLNRVHVLSLLLLLSLSVLLFFVSPGIEGFSDTIPCTVNKAQRIAQAAYEAQYQTFTMIPRAIRLAGDNQCDVAYDYALKTNPTVPVNSNFRRFTFAKDANKVWQVTQIGGHQSGITVKPVQ